MTFRFSNPKIRFSPDDASLNNSHSFKFSVSDTQAAKGTQAKVFCKNGENDRNMIVELSDEESIIELSDQDSNCSDKERMTIHGDKVHDRIRDRSDED